MVLKTAPKPSTSPLKFLISDVYAWQLKRPPRLPHPPCQQRPWWTPLPVQPPWLHTQPLLFSLGLIVSEKRVVVMSLPFPPLLPAAGEAVSVYVVILVYLLFLYTV